ncbi:MAG: peptide deformylase [Planctomycetes bacterium]|nr:peptide deformylase [Planctomycetota bacterium]
MSAPLDFRLTLYPDPLLRKVSSPVVAFDADLVATVRAMFELMYRSRGVGLAAPQAGLDLRILVANPAGEPEKSYEELVLINATILDRSGPVTLYEEGCLSFPQIYAEVKRPERCKVAYQDLSGQRIEREFEGFASRVVQHEYDHLEGVLLVDRMSPADKLRHKLALAELVETYKRNRAGART